MADLSVASILLLAAAATIVAGVVAAIVWRARRRPPRSDPHPALSADLPLLVPDVEGPPLTSSDPTNILGIDAASPSRSAWKTGQVVILALVVAAILTAVLLSGPTPDPTFTWIAAPGPSAGEQSMRPGDTGSRAVGFAGSMSAADGSDGDSPADLASEVRADLADRTAAVDSASGMRLIAWRGDGQSGVPGRPLRSILGVVLRDSSDRPVPGATIRFEVPSGGGRMEPAVARTSDVGLASTAWWLGSNADSLTVTARVADRPALAVRFAATLAEDAPIAESEILADADAEGPDTESTASASSSEASQPAAEPSRAVAGPIRFVSRPGLAAGGVHSCHIGGTGTVRCWGGGAGLSSGEAPELRTVDGGVLDACGVTGAGRILCWDAGRGAIPGSARSIRLPDGAVPVDVVAAADHRCALDRDGAVYCWGSNAQGQLGSGSPDDAAEPTRVEGVPRVRQIVAGWLHTCALTVGGEAYCWGANAAGQIGDGTTIEQRRPVRAAHTGSFTQLAAGSSHTCGLAQNGRLWCWGSNAHGQLGSDIGAASPRPREVEAGVRFRTVVAGGVHTCGLTGAGSAWCWGRNTFGQIGDGTRDNTVVPVPVEGDLRFESLVAGGAHTCGSVAGGTTYCWGNNLQGQVGDGTRQNRASPTVVRLP